MLLVLLFLRQIIATMKKKVVNPLFPPDRVIRVSLGFLPSYDVRLTQKQCDVMHPIDLNAYLRLDDRYRMLDFGDGVFQLICLK